MNYDVIASVDYLKDLNYNTKYTPERNTVVIVKSDSSIKTLRRVDNYIINPSPINLIKRKDPKIYEVYTFHPSDTSYEGRFGGNVVYSKGINKYINERVYIRGNYLFNIYNPSKVLELLSDKCDSYKSLYIETKISELIDNAVKQILKQSLKNYGFEDIYNNQQQYLINELDNILNSRILIKYGIYLSHIKLELEKSSLLQEAETEDKDSIKQDANDISLQVSTIDELNKEINI